MHNKHTFSDFLSFLIPSLLGIFFFLIPIEYQGASKVSIAHLSILLYQYGDQWWPPIIVSLLVIAALLSCWCTFFSPHWVESYPWLSVCVVKPFWLIVRISGAILSILALFRIGEGIFPAYLYDREEGVLFSILPNLLTNLLCGLLLVPLLMQFGLLELVGSFMEGIMRLLFRLPGRSTVDCITSWVGDGTIGTIMSIREYEQGGYTKREASTVISCFSAVSITFCLFLLSEMELENYFGPFYFTLILSSFIAAIVMARIPPLSSQADTYIDGRDGIKERENKAGNEERGWKKGLSNALQKASREKSIVKYIKKVMISWAELIIGALPSVMTIATIGFLLADSTYIKPLLALLGKPFLPLLKWAGIPEAVRASETLFVGFFDMFLPAMMIKELTGEANAITRFVIAALSVTQVVYLSELAPILLESQLKIQFQDLIFIFILRTLITLPIILGCARYFFQ